MPQSKSRHAHKHAHPHSKTPPVHAKPKDNNRVILIAVLFFGFLGLAIGYFINGGSVAVLLTSTILGAAAGFIFGYSIKKSFAGK
jgi:Co/Zn/Cd efflux system component